MGRRIKGVKVAGDIHLIIAKKFGSVSVCAPGDLAVTAA